MEIFEEVVVWLKDAPDWIPLILIPAVALFATIIFTLLGGRRAYRSVALGLGAVGFTLISVKDGALGFVYLGMYSALAALFRLFFLIPKPAFKRQTREEREEKLYRKFLAPTEFPREVKVKNTPPKVCRFEEPELAFSLEESGMRLTHAEEMLTRLKRAPLAASDRLEADVLSRSLGGYRGRRLTEQELGSLNDCLASILKLTAKYKL